MTGSFEAKININGKGKSNSFVPLNELILEMVPQQDEENADNAIHYALHLAKNAPKAYDPMPMILTHFKIGSKIRRPYSTIFVLFLQFLLNIS